MSMFKMVECGVCFEAYQEGELDLHREMCVVRLVFRCTICNRDYMSNEGLWNHLDLHEIADHSKELHCQEIKAKHKLHQCALCNDQRAYSESPYWKHVHNDHDGFFLRCSECGENFRSEKLKYDHGQSNCKTRDQIVTSGCDDLEVDKKVSKIFPIKAEPTSSDSEHFKLSWEEQSNQSNEGIELTVPELDSRRNVYSHVNLNAANDMDNNITEVIPIVKTEEKDLLLPVSSVLPFACDICGITFSSNHAAYYHKRTKHGRMHRCPHCRKIFQIEEFQPHLSSCEKNKISCKLCGSTFEIQRNLSRHMRRIHRIERTVKKPPNEKQPALVVPFACDICGNTFSSYHHVQYHKRKDHKRNHKCPHCRSLFQLEEYQAHLSSCEKKLRISCEICHSKYRNSVYLARHMKRVHRGKGTLDIKNRDQFQEQHNAVLETITSSSREILDSSVNDHSSANSNDAYDAVSNMAEKDITQKSLKQLADNPSDRPSKTKCPQCDGEYTRGRSLHNHIRSTHRPSTCTICGITIYGMEKARYHKVVKHTEPNFECANCSKKFHWKKDFSFHSSNCDPVQIDLPSHKKLQEQNQAEEIDLNMEIKVEETTLVSRDYWESLTDSSTDLHGAKSKDEAIDEDETIRFAIKEECPEEEET